MNSFASFNRRPAFATVGSTSAGAGAVAAGTAGGGELGAGDDVSAFFSPRSHPATQIITAKTATVTKRFMRAPLLSEVRPWSASTPDATGVASIGGGPRWRDRLAQEPGPTPTWMRRRRRPRRSRRA